MSFAVKSLYETKLLAKIDKIKTLNKYDPSYLELKLDIYNNSDYKNIMKSFIKEIGLEKIALLTKEFNDMMIKENEKMRLESNPISK